MEEMDFPEGWALTNLEGIITISSGKGLPKTKMVAGSVPVYGGNGITGMHNAPNVNEPTIVIGRVGFYCGSVHITPEEAWVTDNAFITSFNPKHLDKLFLYRLLTATNLRGDDSSTAQPVISGRKVYPVTVLLPPLPEQKVIAEKLDSLLAQVETTKAHLDRIPNILKRFRQSVLAAAVSGRLTTDWRRENKSKITVDILKKEIKSYRLKAWINEQENKFISKGKWPKNEKWKQKYTEPSIPEDFHFQELPDGWSYQPLEGLVYISARIGWKGLKASEYTESGPLFLSVHSLNYGTTVKLSEAFHISMERYQESPEIILQNDDILLCKDGAGIGKLGIVKGLEGPATINSSLLLIRSGDFFIPEYLYYFFAGPRMQSIVHERMTGSAVPHLFQRDVKEFVLEVPPIEEQAEIVRRVEELFALADAIEQKAQAATERVNKLTQSILAKAFRGDLTKDWRAASPDLISGENSAEALLEKIKAEREAMKPNKKTRAKKVKA